MKARKFFLPLALVACALASSLHGQAPAPIVMQAANAPVTAPAPAIAPRPAAPAADNDAVAMKTMIQQLQAMEAANAETHQEAGDGSANARRPSEGGGRNQDLQQARLGLPHSGGRAGAAAVLHGAEPLVIFRA